MLRILVLTYLLLRCCYVSALPTHRQLSGYVYDRSTQLPIAGVNIYETSGRKGTISDSKGYFSLSIPIEATISLNFSFVGFRPVSEIITPDQKGVLAVYLSAGQTLTEQTIKVVKNSSGIDNAQMSALSLSMDKLSKIPVLLGEKDALKVLQLLPGVQKGAEGSAGIYVRGGAPDQNLILLDNTPIYNPNHLLGFFSAFNGDVLNRVDLTKGGFPARFGGRLSSVIELTTKDGSTDRLRGEASAGVVASRLTLSGPLSPNVSFVLAGRRTYLDMVTGLLGTNTADQPVLKTFFHDLNAKLTIRISETDKVYVSGYASKDKFNNIRTEKGPLRSALQWGNGAGSIRWSHRGATGATSEATLFYSQYAMNMQDQQTIIENNVTNTYNLFYQSAISDLSGKYDISQYVNDRHQLRYGGQVTHHQFTPQAHVGEGNADVTPTTNDERINTLEGGAYIEHSWSPGSRWRINSGLRLSAYTVLGKGTGRDSAASAYVRPEPRLSMAYRVTPSLSVKGSYALMNQYVHLLSSTGIGLSTDLWVPTIDRIRPQTSQQVALGFVNEWAKTGLTLTLEGYYKRMDNLLSYREGASFMSTNAQGRISSAKWIDNVTSGQGASYGTEFLLQKQAGRFSGWLGYTLSWTRWQFDALNGGKPFFPRYDRRHDASVVGIYELSPSISLSGAWVYGTGNALTLPLSRYSGYSDQKNVAGSLTSSAVYGSAINVKEYGERNSFRAEAYHRLDVSLRFTRKRRSYERVWELSVYNVYNRRNAFLYSLEGKEQGLGLPSKTVLYKYSLFPVVPSVSYTVRF